MFQPLSSVWLPGNIAIIGLVPTILVVSPMGICCTAKNLTKIIFLFREKWKKSKTILLMLLLPCGNTIDNSNEKNPLASKKWMNQDPTNECLRNKINLAQKYWYQWSISINFNLFYGSFNFADYVEGQFM